MSADAKDLLQSISEQCLALAGDMHRTADRAARAGDATLEDANTIHQGAMILCVRSGALQAVIPVLSPDGCESLLQDLVRQGHVRLATVGGGIFATRTVTLAIDPRNNPGRLS
jgi:hypothetical protein